MNTFVMEVFPDVSLDRIIVELRGMDAGERTEWCRKTMTRWSKDQREVILNYIKEDVELLDLNLERIRRKIATDFAERSTLARHPLRSRRDRVWSHYATNVEASVGGIFVNPGEAFLKIPSRKFVAVGRPPLRKLLREHNFYSNKHDRMWLLQGTPINRRINTSQEIEDIIINTIELMSWENVQGRVWSWDKR